MKHINQHIIKKSYTKPVIEEVMIDREMSLFMLTGEPPVEFSLSDPTIDQKSDNSQPFPESPTYRDASGSVDSPFGGSKPVY
jgi:hypothetical protein